MSSDWRELPLENCPECSGTGVREIRSSGDRETGFEREWDACDCGAVVENDQPDSIDLLLNAEARRISEQGGV